MPANVLKPRTVLEHWSDAGFHMGFGFSKYKSARAPFFSSIGFHSARPLP